MVRYPLIHLSRYTPLSGIKTEDLFFFFCYTKSSLRRKTLEKKMDPIDIDFSEGEHTVLLSSPHSVEAISFPPLRFIFWWFSQLRGLPDPVLDDVDIDVD